MFCKKEMQLKFLRAMVLLKHSVAKGEKSIKFVAHNIGEGRDSLKLAALNVVKGGDSIKFVVYNEQRVDKRWNCLCIMSQKIEQISLEGRD